LTTKYFSFQYSATQYGQAFRRLAHRARETVHPVNSRNSRLHHSSSVASQHSWP